ncbi:hypothetical protein [Pararhizobium mangrovi]|uniref:Uncharacterized protein n=1 Tax=Pararhizobium mangrovi TaxID=2590452 RepID=A0A506U0P1_9HYPH|nr:hypothetical protein [Pararhizobium mangrovi]TPW27048.1 hypothetical protein FJU11_12970 [Pararhizobium mangrovi]
MGELRIELDDTELVRTLEDLASHHGQTVEAELRSLIENAAAEHRKRAERVRRAREISAMTPKDIEQSDSVETIRQMREERDRQLGR